MGLDCLNLHSLDRWKGSPTGIISQCWRWRDGNLWNLQQMKKKMKETLNKNPPGMTWNDPACRRGRQQRWSCDFLLINEEFMQEMGVTYRERWGGGKDLEEKEERRQGADREVANRWKEEKLSMSKVWLKYVGNYSERWDTEIGEEMYSCSKMTRMNTKQTNSEFPGSWSINLGKRHWNRAKIKDPWIAGKKNPDRICRKYFTERETAR